MKIYYENVSTTNDIINQKLQTRLRMVWSKPLFNSVSKMLSTNINSRKQDVSVWTNKSPDSRIKILENITSLFPYVFWCGYKRFSFFSWTSLPCRCPYSWSSLFSCKWRSSIPKPAPNLRTGSSRPPLIAFIWGKKTQNF